MHNISLPGIVEQNDVILIFKIIIFSTKWVEIIELYRADCFFQNSKKCYQ